VPYIITTNRYMDDPTAEFLPGAKPGIERRAVATLDEAKGAVIRELAPRIDSAFEWDLGLEGGTVGPLPDGTVIEVKRVAWLNLARGVGLDCGDMCAVPNAEILDVYNAEGSNR
jgi:hypothetical protein